MKTSTKGKSTGLHKRDFNGSPAQDKQSHPIAPPPSTPVPRPKGY